MPLIYINKSYAKLIAVIAHTEHSINLNRLVPRVQVTDCYNNQHLDNHSTKWELISMGNKPERSAHQSAKLMYTHQVNH